MRDHADPVNAMRELPEETQEFLARLRPDDIQTLEEGVRLVNAVKTVGTFVKWMIVGVLGLALGTVMFAESVGKILGWVRD